LLYWQTKKFSVRIFILPVPDVLYILSPLVGPGCTHISFYALWCFDVAFAAGKNKSRPKRSQHRKIKCSHSQRLTVSTKFYGIVS